MALTPGNTVLGTTTLAALIDSVYANKTAALTGASATFTALDANTLKVGWTTNNGDNVCYIRIEPRGVLPAVILL